MKQAILVTGHTGFIGRALVQALDSGQKYNIIGHSRLAGDLLDYESLVEMPPIVKIVHLAGSVGVPRSWKRPLETYQNNILPMLNILELARHRQIPVIYLSSYLYGTPQYLPIDEVHPVSCNNPYAHSKRQAEMLCEAYAKDFGISIAILRPFNIYGPKQSQDSLIPHIIAQAKQKQRIRVKDLKPKRDYLYIDDLVSAILSVIDAEQSSLDIYNLGYGTSYSVQEVIALTLKLMNKQILVTSTEEYRPNEIMDCYSDSQKFSKRFSWTPKVTLEAGIEAVLKSVEEQAAGTYV